MRNYISADDYITMPGERNCGEVKVDKIGYVSPKRQIEALFYAGGQFLSPEKEEYEYEDIESCIKDNGSSPVRDADIIDISKLSELYAQRSVTGGSVNDVGSNDDGADLSVESKTDKV